MQAVAQLCDRAILIESGQRRRRRPAGRGRRALPPRPTASGTERTWDDGDGAGRRPRRGSWRSGCCRTTGMPPGVVDVRRPVGIEIAFRVLRDGKPVFPKIKVLDQEGAIAFNAMDIDARWHEPIAAGRVRRDGVDPGQPPQRGVRDRRRWRSAASTSRSSTTTQRLRGGLVRGARSRRGRLGSRGVQRNLARRRAAAARVDFGSPRNSQMMGSPLGPGCHRDEKSSAAGRASRRESTMNHADGWPSSPAWLVCSSCA